MKYKGYQRVIFVGGVYRSYADQERYEKDKRIKDLEEEESI